MALLASACSSNPPVRPLGSLKPYSAFGATVEMAFPGTPTPFPNPFAFRGLFPGHTAATSWSIGDLGNYKVNSYELVMMQFPSSYSVDQIDTEVAGYGGPLRTTLFGHPAIKNVSPTHNGRYAGVLAFTTGHVLVIAGGYDIIEAPITRFIDSIKLAHPAP
jgi:hypothetical protein